VGTGSPRRGTEAIAKLAVARKRTTPSGAIKSTMTIFLRRELAEALTARTLREGKNTPLLIAELLDTAMRRPG